MRARGHAEPLEVIKRVAIGIYNDGFIHAGNLAYLAVLAIFPFFITGAAIARLFGQTERAAWMRSTPCSRPCRPSSPTCCGRRSTT